MSLLSVLRGDHFFLPHALPFFLLCRLLIWTCMDRALQYPDGHMCRLSDGKVRQYCLHEIYGRFRVLQTLSSRVLSVQYQTDKLPEMYGWEVPGSVREEFVQNLRCRKKQYYRRGQQRIVLHKLCSRFFQLRIRFSVHILRSWQKHGRKSRA